MLQKVQKFITENQLLSPENGPVIVGVSGGSDSVVLLDILSKSGFQCILAHCNFHLRTEESMRDQEFVRILSNKYDLPFITIDFQTNRHAKQHGVSIEMAARDLRYDWFEKMRLKHGAQAIATGHHLDDNIETVLLNFTRGTGLKGLTGIPVRNENVIRPLLSSSRTEIKQYIEKNKLEFVEDSTNASTDFIRNKFRHEIIPMLEEINPSFRKTCIDTLENLQGTYNIFQQEISKIKTDVSTFSNSTHAIDIQKLSQYKDINTVLFELLKDYGFHSDQIKQIRQSLDSVSGKQFYSKTHCLLKDRNQLIIQDLMINAAGSADEKQRNNTGRLTINLFERDESFVYATNNQTVHLDADKVILPLKTRKWQEADYFYPLGMKGRKKLSNYFIDQKINRFDKEHMLVVLSEDHIVWVVGQRIDERFKVTEETRRILELRYI